MTAPQRLRLSRAKGWRLAASAVHVGRPSRWGNPFVVGKHGTRLQCAAMYFQLARGFITFSQDIDVEVQMTHWRRIQRHVHDLAGKDLACWCALDGGACHADVLLMLANPGMPLADWMRAPVDLPRVRIGMRAQDVERLERAKRERERAAEKGEAP